MSRAFEQPLYHGTIEAIQRIDVSRGRAHKDFGRGFYMSMTPKQAIGMMHKKLREAVRRSRNAERSEFVEHLYRVQLKPSFESELKVKVFDIADMEWLEFILMCRESELPHPHGFDIVIGPTADDDTLVSLQNYWKGVYGPIGSVAAKMALLSVLEPENLGIQCCLCSKESESSVMTFAPVNWKMYV